MRVTTAEFIRNYSVLADKALAEPLTITKHGRDRLVLLSAAEYDRLRRRDRRVVAAEELTDGEAALIAQAATPPQDRELDSELCDWTL